MKEAALFIIIGMVVLVLAWPNSKKDDDDQITGAGGAA